MSYRIWKAGALALFLATVSAWAQAPLDASGASGLYSRTGFFARFSNPTPLAHSIPQESATFCAKTSSAIPPHLAVPPAAGVPAGFRSLHLDGTAALLGAAMDRFQVHPARAPPSQQT
jgi:hypothetical protein